MLSDSLTKMEDAESKSRSEPIAIIGLSCRFAGEACNPEGLWKLIAEGRDTWTEIPTSRFNSKGFLHPDPQSLDTVCVPNTKRIDRRNR